MLKTLIYSEGLFEVVLEFIQIEIEVAVSIQWKPPADSEEDEDGKAHKYKNTKRDTVNYGPPDGRDESPSCSDIE